MPRTFPRLFVLAVGASVLAVAAGASGQGRSRDDTGLGGTGLAAFAQLVVDARSAPTGRIAFSAGSHPHEDIYVVNADGSGLLRLTDDTGADLDPSWSPDGRRIAYRHETGGGDASAEIYVMDADGSQKRNLTGRPGQDHSPAWSPDGRRIAFASVRGRPMPSIWVMNADGSGQKRVSRAGGEYPAWSPDGRKIAFDRNTFGPTGWDIWVVNADGSRAKPLVAWRTNEQGAAWSPDGEDRLWLRPRSGPWLRPRLGRQCRSFAPAPLDEAVRRPTGMVAGWRLRPLHRQPTLRRSPRRLRRDHDSRQRPG